MRYRDAAHMNFDAYYRRRDFPGWIFDLLGWVIGCFVATDNSKSDGLPWLFFISLSLWIFAWFLQVGSSYRLSLAFVIFLSLVNSVFHRFFF